MAQKINPKQYQRDMIQCLHSGTQSITSTAATVAYSGGTIAIGTRVTQSGSTVVIGSGVSKVKVSYGIMSENGGTASYLYSRIKINAAELSQQIDGSTSQFRSTSDSRIFSVSSGDVISVVADSGGGSLNIRYGQLIVEVLE